jgi:Ca-activated chloride channel homolog
MKKLISILFIGFALSSMAQEDKKQIISGNNAFEKGEFSEAEGNYRQAENSEKLKDIATYNLGDALYRQGKFDEAADNFGKVAEQSQDPNLKAKALHNLGNSYLSKQEFGKALDSYKQALRLNPNDDDSRYNLAYARKMIQQQQEQQQQQDQNQDQENKDENKEENKDQNQDDKSDQEKEGDQDQQKDGEDQENKDGEQDKDGEQNQENKDQNGENQQEKEMQLNPDDITPEDAARILEALDKAEEDLQGKLRKNKQSGKPRKIEKDW